jgi:hypothetical protein
LQLAYGVSLKKLSDESIAPLKSLIKQAPRYLQAYEELLPLLSTVGCFYNSMRLKNYFTNVIHIQEERSRFLARQKSILAREDYFQVVKILFDKGYFAQCIQTLLEYDQTHMHWEHSFLLSMAYRNLKDLQSQEHYAAEAYQRALPSRTVIYDLNTALRINPSQYSIAKEFFDKSIPKINHWRTSVSILTSFHSLSNIFKCLTIRLSY